MESLASHWSTGSYDRMAEKVVDYKFLNGKRYYKVEWKCTWEEEANLLACQQLVDQFWGFVNRVKSEDYHITACKQGQSDASCQVESEDVDRQAEADVSTQMEANALHAVEEADVSSEVVEQDGSCQVKSPISSYQVESEGLCKMDAKTSVVNLTTNEFPKVTLIAYEDTYEQCPDDRAIHWINPYVRVSFMCRVCTKELRYSRNEEKWKKHFLTHVHGAQQQEEEEEDISESADEVAEEGALEDVAFIEDPDRPWIQKVEYMIQKWGVNQYIRLAFLCRLCKKEQQPLHTGNWRNHYNSHQDNKPHSCAKCSKTFKSKYYLRQHLKLVHNEVEVKTVARPCFICAKVFTRKLDLKRHIADVHSIHPEVSADECQKNSHFTTNQPCDFVKDGSPRVHITNKNVNNDLISSNNLDLLPACNTKTSLSSPSRNKASFPAPVHNKTVPLSAFHNKNGLPSPVHNKNKCLQTHDKNTYPTSIRNKHFQSSFISLPSRSNSSQSHSSENKVTCGKCFQTYASKSELVRHRRNCYFYFKHTCGICHKGFKKKLDLKCHTADVHCIDVSHSMRNENSSRNESSPRNENSQRTTQTEELGSSMVNLVHNTLLKKKMSVNDFPKEFSNSSSNEADDGISIEGTEGRNKTDSEDLMILVKEEMMSSEDEEKCSELTIDERPPLYQG